MSETPARLEWVRPLLAIFLLQGTGSFLLQLLPTLAPALSAELGWSATTVGYAASISMSAALLFLLFGTQTIRRNGPIRSIQAGLALGLVGIAILVIPLAAAPIAAAFAMGLAYGPSMPAGSAVLIRYAPERFRSLVFSIKQAGVPVGAAVAGLSLPAIATEFGLHAALTAAALVVAVAIFAVQPLRRTIDADAFAVQARAVSEPRPHPRLFAGLRAQPALFRLSAAGGCLSFTQGAWNAVLVTYLVFNQGLSLGRAGLVFAMMQVAAVVGRLVLGHLADRLRSGALVLRGAAVASAGATLALAFIDESWSEPGIFALAAFGGVAVTGWNGVLLAELATRAKPEAVNEVSADGMVIVSLGLIAGPFALALLAETLGGFANAFAMLAPVPLLGAVLVGSMRRSDV